MYCVTRECKLIKLKAGLKFYISLGYWNIPVNLDDALRWYDKRIDKEIGIMSARSAQPYSLEALENGSGFSR